MQLTLNYMYVHTYAVGVADIAAREGLPHNVLHSSSCQVNDNYHVHVVT